jgi:hypothetical protein
MGFKDEIASPSIRGRGTQGIGFPNKNLKGVR